MIFEFAFFVVSINIFGTFGSLCQRIYASKISKRKAHIGGFQLEFVSIIRIMNHMTRYEFKSSHSGKFILKNPLQHLLSSRNAVISTNESTQIITGHVIIQRGLSGLYLDYTYKLQLKTTIVLDLSSYYSSLLPF